MEARMQLAALDHNCNVNREQAVVKKARKGSAPVGTLRFQSKYSKATSQWVVKPIPVAKSYNFIDDILTAMVDRLPNDPLPKASKPAFVPKNAAPTQMNQTKAALILAHQSRFDKL